MCVGFSDHVCYLNVYVSRKGSIRNFSKTLLLKKVLIFKRYCRIFKHADKKINKSFIWLIDSQCFAGHQLSIFRFTNSRFVLYHYNLWMGTMEFDLMTRSVSSEQPSWMAHISIVLTMQLSIVELLNICTLYTVCVVNLGQRLVWIHSNISR